MNFKKSTMLFKEAKKHIVGGVNSPVRAYKAIGIDPVFIKKAKGSKIYDEDNNELIDYVNSYGPIIVGHANDLVIKKIKETIGNGLSFGASTLLEIQLAKMIKEAFESIELLRFVNSGTEATMSAIRLARGVTERDNILKFIGCYHGHSDDLLVASGSGASTFGIPTSKGVPLDFAKHTLLAEYNDIEKVQEIFKKYGDSIACVIVEPIAGNMGLIKPRKGFLEILRQLTIQYESLLIFDEVMSGFRITYGGVEKIFGIKPDITTVGKVIGGGMPTAAYGGSKDVMSFVSPEGDVYQAGTLSGNPIAMATGIATLNILKTENPYNSFEKKTHKLTSNIVKIAEEYAIGISENHVGSMFSLFFNEKTPQNYSDVLKSNTKLFAKYFIGMLKNGVYLPPSQFETNFISTSHTDEDIEKTIETVKIVFKNL